MIWSKDFHLKWQIDLPGLRGKIKTFNNKGRNSKQYRKEKAAACQ